MNDIASSDSLAPRVGEDALPEAILVKLAEWRSQHFSQLEKIAKARGLHWQTSHLDRSADRPIEEAKKTWLLDRLVTYELHALDTRLSKQETLDETGNKEDDDLDGCPLDDMDGAALSSDDEEAVLRYERFGDETEALVVRQDVDSDIDGVPLGSAVLASFPIPEDDLANVDGVRINPDELERLMAGALEVH